MGGNGRTVQAHGQSLCNTAIVVSRTRLPNPSSASSQRRRSIRSFAKYFVSAHTGAGFALDASVQEATGRAASGDYCKGAGICKREHIGHQRASWETRRVCPSLLPLSTGPNGPTAQYLRSMTARNHISPAFGGPVRKHRWVFFAKSAGARNGRSFWINRLENGGFRGKLTRHAILLDE